MIAQQTIQEILSKIDIVEIVGGFVRLKKRGTNYLGLCPFHNEKSPSFTVSPSKEIYKCFGCGRSGNSISFLMEHEKYSYVESLRWLAAKYNVTIEETEVSPELKLQHQVSDSLFIINSFAQKFFTQALLETEHGIDIGLSYLKKRGFREDIIKKFQLGFSPEEKSAFSKVAVTNQFNQEYLVKSGLVVMRNDELVDNYRGRIIFPVHNNTGKIMGFGARLIKNNDKAPKYINTPENEVYSKSKILYGTYFARQAIDKNDECLLVEGYTDVISLHQAGIENVVASGGTSLTVDQLRLIKKYTNNLTIIYDGDPAGVKAALRGLDMSLEEGINVRLVLIPDKEDPDSYVTKIGPAAFRQFIDGNKKDFILFQLEVALKDAGNDSSKKAAVVNQVAETISKINKAEDFTRQQDYIRKSADLLKIEETGLNVLVNKYIRERVSKQEFKVPVEDAPVAETIEGGDRSDWSNESFSLLHQDILQEQAIVRVLLEHGLKKWDDEKSVAEYIFDENIDDDLFEDEKLLKTMHMYKRLYLSGADPTVKQLVHDEDEEIAHTAITITNFPYDYSQKWLEDLNAGGVNEKIWTMPYQNFMKHIIINGEINREVYNTQRDDDYKHVVEDAMVFLKLRKLKKLILMNQKDMQLQHPDNEMMTLIQTHSHLKQIQMELGKNKGMALYPF